MPSDARAAGSRLLPPLLIASLASFFLAAGSFPLRNYDLWFHLAAGRWMLEHGEVIRADPFSFTAAGAPWIAHEWGFEIVAALLHRLGGADLLVAARAGLVLAVVPLGLLACRAAGAGVLPASLLLGFWALLSQIYLYARPQAVTYALLALLLWLLMRWKYRGGRLIWILPPLFLVWANLHAGFLAGLLVLGVFAAGEAVQTAFPLLRRDPARSADPAEVRRLIWAAGAGALATLVNPYGLRLYLLPGQITGSAYMQSAVSEWLPAWDPRFRGDPDVWLFWLALPLALAALLADGRRRDWTHLALVALFGLLALRSVRHIPLFGIVALAPVARALSGAAPRLRERLAASRRGGGRGPAAWRAERGGGPRAAALLALAALLGAGTLWSALRGFPLTGRPAFRSGVERGRLPVAMVDWMEAHGVDGRVFNAYVFGGYLAFRQHPRTLVAMDGRNEVYGEARLREHYDALADPDVFRSLHQRHDVELVLLDARRRDLDEPLFRFLLSSPGWALVHTDQDRVANLFVRRGIPRFEEVAAEGW